MPIGDVITTATSPTKADQEDNLAVFAGTDQPALGTRVVPGPRGAGWFGVGGTFKFPPRAYLTVVAHDDNKIAPVSPSGARVPCYSFDIVTYSGNTYRVLSPLRPHPMERVGR